MARCIARTVRGRDDQHHQTHTVGLAVAGLIGALVIASTLGYGVSGSIPSRAVAAVAGLANGSGGLLAGVVLAPLQQTSASASATPPVATTARERPSLAGAGLAAVPC